MGFVGKPRCRIRWRVYIHYERSGVCKPVCRVGLDPPLVLGVLWWGKPHPTLFTPFSTGMKPRVGAVRAKPAAARQPKRAVSRCASNNLSLR